MIKYPLTCAAGHDFEGWFSASEDFGDQQARGLIACPLCGSGEVRKQITAPAVAGTKAQGSPPEANPQMRSMMMEAMGRLRDHVEENFDYVADKFADEALAIHEGRSEDRGIYGEATAKEVRELDEAGVRVAPLPPKPPKRSEVN
jgi:hypothetical protein